MSSYTMQIFERLFRAKRNKSFFSFLLYIFSSPFRKLRREFDKRAISRIDSLQDRFTLIYRRNAWGSKESVSGSGSTFAMTNSVRSLLPIIFEKFEIKSILDVPCGDFNWMKLVDLNGISYLGGDIVEPLVADLNRNFSSTFVSFTQFDITIDRFPKSDLVLNRDCLFHLSYRDIQLTLSNFLKSGSMYFLSTSYENGGKFTNTDIRSGDFRLIDLFTSPFCFPANFHFEVPEQGEGALPPRKLYMWDRDQVSIAHKNLESYLFGH